ncbi:MAG TPA: septum formation family protein [Nocardioides sp.]|nr:septum formation family protein [Nocardioides sp.]
MLPRVAAAVLLLLTTACTGSAGDEEADTAPPKLGACRLLTPADIAETSNDSPAVDCSKRHTAETFAVGTFPDAVGDEIDDPALGAHVFEVCERKFRKFLGGNESLVLRAMVTWAWFRPSEDQWDSGARWWRCDVVGGGEESTELVNLPETAAGLLLGRPDDRWMVCVDGPSVAESAKIPCSRPHTWRAVTTIVVGDDEDPYPGDRLVEVRTRDYCSDSVGAWLNYPVDYDFGFTWFHEAEWEAGNRRSICWARTDQ